MRKSNYHTHCTFCDGKNTMEELVLKAIELNFTSLGFSSHEPNSAIDPYSMKPENLKAYIDEFCCLKEKYGHKIHLYLGLEVDSTCLKNKIVHNFDYTIGSVHFVNCNKVPRAIDCSKQYLIELVEQGYNGDFIAFGIAYFNEVQRLIKIDDFDILGHIDLITKFNEADCLFDSNDPIYLQALLDTVACAIDHHKIIEINTGAIARGYRTSFYPCVKALEYINEHKGSIILNSDCHNADYLDCYFNEALHELKSIGFTSLMDIDDGVFKSFSIDEFLDVYQ